MTASTMVTSSFYRSGGNCGGCERSTAFGAARRRCAGAGDARGIRRMREGRVAGFSAWRQLGAWVMALASFGGGLSFLSLFSDEFLFRQLADRGLGQDVTKLQVRGQFVPAELVGQKRTQFLERKALPGG